MALDFPASPTNGQQFNDWVYDSSNQSWRFAQTQPGGLPCGAIIPWAGATAPPNWLLCDGSAVSRTTYSSLFAVIGTSYGTGNGSTTFNVPDLRGRVAVGLDSSQTEFNTLGETGGAKTHTLSIAEMPSHTHIQNSHTHSERGASNYPGILSAPGSSYGVAVDTAYTTGATTATNQNTGGGGAHNNLQPYQVVNYIIKTTVAITPGESELAPRVTTVENRATAVESRATALELADSTTNRAGLVPVVPTSVSLGSGSSTVSGTGEVSFSGANRVSLNGVFTNSYRAYRVIAKYRNVSNNSTTAIQLRLRASNTDFTSSDWVFGGNNPITISAGSVSANNWGAWGANLCHFGYIAPNYGWAIMDFIEPYVAAPTSIYSTSAALNTTTNAHYAPTFSGAFNSSVLADGFSFFTSPADNFTGTIEVYGYR